MTRIDQIKGVFLHNLAVVETNHVGEGSRIWAFAHILNNAIVGKNCNICDHTFIEGNVIIGDNVTIKNGVYLWDGLRIADNVFIGPNATFTNDIRPRSQVYTTEFVKTHIQKGASIGANATVLCGITVGQWAMVGSGSVLTKDVPDHALVYGNPAKVKGYVCECCRDLHFKNASTHCECGKTYKLDRNCVVRI